MANKDAPRGFRPVRHLTGGEIRTESLSIANAYATALGRGTLVAKTGTSDNVALAAPGDAAVGVLYAVKYTLASGEIVYRKDWPGNPGVKSGTTVEALVFTDPDIVFAIQHDGTPVAGNVGNLFDTTAESVSDLGFSTMEIDTSTNATGAQLRTLSFVDSPDNTIGEFAEQEVIIAAHQYRAAAAI